MREKNMKEAYKDAEHLVFAKEEDLSKDEKVHDNWKVLIVDDEEDVHQITKMVLSEIKFNGKGIEFLSAYSAKETMRLMEENQDIALILLDVVMEEEDSGLKVAKAIREDLNNKLTRIILRTGQPGQAPEKRVILDYDINDYKEKTELTSQKLFTTVIASLRAYQDIMIIEDNRRALQRIIETSPQIFELQSLREFASAVLAQMISIMSLSKNTIYCNSSGFAATKNAKSKDFYIMAAAGDYKDKTDKRINEAIDENIFNYIQKALKEKKSLYFDGRYVAYFQSKNGSENIIYTESTKKLTEMDMDLINLFCNNVSMAFENIYLNTEIEETQKEIIFTLGEITEARSIEMGNHVRRVAEYCKILALGYGLSEKEAELIKMASSIHDIGKIAISDKILNKPDKLTAEEFEDIKNHSALGYELLKGSKRKLLRAASIITYEHHEKYDGTGYPRGLKGEEIHIYGRISCIADVFDALGSERPYKKAWSLEQILQYFKEQKGKHFDPVLVDILFYNLDKILEIKRKFSDKLEAIEGEGL